RQVQVLLPEPRVDHVRALQGDLKGLGCSAKLAEWPADPVSRPLVFGPRYHQRSTGRGAAWLARLSGGQEVPGSNPGAPTAEQAAFGSDLALNVPSCGGRQPPG